MNGQLANGFLSLMVNLRCHWVITLHLVQVSDALLTKATRVESN